MVTSVDDRCRKRVPDHTDFVECGGPAVRLGMCAFHVDVEVAKLCERISSLEDEIRSAEVRIVELLGGPEAVREAEVDRACAT